VFGVWKLKRAIVAVAIAFTALLSTASVANAAPEPTTVSVNPSASMGFPVRVVSRTVYNQPVTPLRLPIGPKCWELTVFGIEVGFRTFCTNEVAWRTHPVGSVWEGGF
jgi:hypothetical protein